MEAVYAETPPASAPAGLTCVICTPQDEQDMNNAEDKVLALLGRLGIDYKILRHPPMHTVEEAQALRGDWPGGHTKCLYLADKAGAELLAVVEENRRVNLKALHKALGVKRLSLANPEQMEKRLGVRPGAVTPLALINARVEQGGTAPLGILLDHTLAARDPLHFHPLHNEATVRISWTGLLRFIEDCGYAPLVFDFDRGMPI